MAKTPGTQEKRKAKEAGRSGLIALAIIIGVLALVSSLVSLAFYYSDSIAARFVAEQNVTADQDLATVYQRRATTLSPSNLARAVMGDAFGRIDYGSFLAAEPWLSVRRSMTLRLIAYGVIVLGALLTFASKPRGPRIMLGACLVLVLHGFFESLTIFSHGQALAAEFSRDLAVQVVEVIEAAKLESNYAGRAIAFRPLEPNEWKFAVGIYFVVVTIFWQIAAVALALFKPPSKQENKEEKAV